MKIYAPFLVCVCVCICVCSMIHDTQKILFFSTFFSIYELDRSFAHPDHEFSKFATGNKSTLNIDGIRDRLIEFYKTYYSSNLMTLAVTGKETVRILAFQMIVSTNDDLLIYLPLPVLHLA